MFYLQKECFTDMTVIIWDYVRISLLGSLVKINFLILVTQRKKNRPGLFIKEKVCFCCSSVLPHIQCLPCIFIGVFSNLLCVAGGAVVMSDTRIWFPHTLKYQEWVSLKYLVFRLQQVRTKISPWKLFGSGIAVLESTAITFFCVGCINWSGPAQTCIHDWFECKWARYGPFFQGPRGFK